MYNAYTASSCSVMGWSRSYWSFQPVRGGRDSALLVEREAEREDDSDGEDGVEEESDDYRGEDDGKGRENA